MNSLTIYLMLLSQNIETNPGMNPNPTFSILTYNCNGLGDPQKLRQLLTKLAPMVNKGCIVFLQETHIIDTGYLKLLWREKFESNCCSTSSAGVITLYKSDLNILDIYKDQEGRQLTIVINKENRNYIAANVYFPNDHKKGIDFSEQVYLKILEFQHKYPENYTLLGGDFNTCMTKLDYLNRNNTQNERLLAENITFNNRTTKLIDSYRTRYKEGGFTWKRGTCYSRLDYIFVSESLLANISKVEHNWSFETSDHAALSVEFKLNQIPVRGPGISKVNTNILDDPKTLNEVRFEIKSLMEQVGTNWDPHMTLEFLKMNIRSVLSAKTSDIRKFYFNEIKELEDEINQLESIRISTLENLESLEENDESKINNVDLAIRNLKTKLHILRNKASETQSFKSKAKWFEYGEKSNKFFLNLLKSRQNQQLIHKIVGNGVEYSGQEEVTKGITNFYRELYDKKTGEYTQDKDYYKYCPKLNPEQATSLEQELTLNNLHEALKTCKDSSPGPDGIPYIVYKKLWEITGPYILNSWKYSIETGNLAPSHNESVITLLPKEGKDKGDIKNWRPITLSNCDAKIITKALTIRISKVLNSIIDESQTAYVPGRSVSDNLRTNFYVKNLCRKKNLSSVLISLDAKKAFDSVDHKYIEETLRAYGFGEGFIHVFKTLYRDITARVLVNGFQSDPINIRRGVKQGDSLSCAIFIICIDPVLRNINNSRKIRSINLGLEIEPRNPFKAGAYADDISVVCMDDNQSIQEVFEEYSRLTCRSGLELNAEKTEILRLNSSEIKKISFTYNSHLVEIDTVNTVKICGLIYSNDPDLEYSKNVTDKIDKLSIKIRQWIPRHLTMEGKILIVKTFGLSQLIYNMQSYGIRTKELKLTESIIFKFIWSTNDNQNGIDRIKRSILKNNYENGGLKIPDVECLDRSLKLKQFIRAHNSNHFIKTLQRNLTKGDIKQEYYNISETEDICRSAQETINYITDHNRGLYKEIQQDEYEADKNLIDEVSSINLRTYLKRKNRVFALCVLKQINEKGIITLGELMSAYEYESDTNTNKSMKIVINSFPKHLQNIAKCFNEETNSSREVLEYILLKPHTRTLLDSLTTKDLQITLKNALNRVETLNYDTRLGTVNFNIDNVVNFRNNCKNSKLRNIYFRLIHNDFFTYARMYKYKMTENDECP